ncbi:MAG: ribonuclease P protein component 4 [Candidatus Hodarchaeota archaeon]
MQRLKTCVEIPSFFRGSKKNKASFKNASSVIYTMARRIVKNKQKMKKIAEERIDILFQRSRECSKGDTSDQALSRRYVFLARKLAMGTRTPLKWEHKRRICRNCNSLLVPGHTSRVRLKGKGKNAHVVVTCLHCGNIRRYHYHRPSSKKGGR